MREFRKILSLLMVLTLLVGLFAFNASAESEADCANGKHTPGEKVAANYTECGGGYEQDYYLCTYCNAPCDTDGNSVTPYDFHKEGTQQHTPSGNPIPGCLAHGKTEWYVCSVCGEGCLADGSSIRVDLNPDWSSEERHTPGSIEYPANYTPCGGGIKTPYYRCTGCGKNCDKDGIAVGYSMDSAPEEGSKHTPGLRHAADYTPCSGGYKTEWYTCSVCGGSCDAEGGLLYPDYVYNGIHTPGDVEFPADYTPCGGGYKVPYYICSVCGIACTKNGSRVEKIIAPEDNLLTQSSPCHSPSGEEHPADYHPCTGGYKEAYYICSVCGKPCNKDKIGLSSSYTGYSPAIAAHKLVTVPAKAATVDAEGNIEYVKCSTCGSLYKDAQSAQINTPCSLSDVTLPKLSAETKPEPTPPAETAPTQKVVISEAVTEVPGSIADQYGSIEAMSREMTLAAIENSTLFKDTGESEILTRLIDVTLMVETDGGWVPVTEDNFPKVGVTVTLPYPEGVDKNTHVFAVAHMITTSDRAGEVEIVLCTPTADGLRATFTSLSPVMIIYREKTADEMIAPLPGAAAKTGDESMVWVWMAIMDVSAVGVILLINKKARAGK